MKIPHWTDLLGSVLVFLLSVFLGATMIGQFVTITPIPLIFGLICGVINLTTAEWYGRLNLRLLRRFITLVGLVTVLAVYLTGMFTVNQYLNVDVEVYLKAGMQTWPVYTAMAGAILLTFYLHRADQRIPTI